MIKTIFFDLGEVVLTNDWHYECPEKFRAFSEYFSITNDQMEDGWNTAWPLYELGKISENAFWEDFLRASGTTKIDTHKAKALWRKYFGSKPGMFELLHKLKTHYTLTVLSSTGKEWLDYKIQKYNLDSFFSFYITTSATGLKKTDKRIYELALKETRTRPEEALFVDDTWEALNAAQQVGIGVIPFQNSQQLEKELTNLGLFSPNI